MNLRVFRPKNASAFKLIFDPTFGKNTSNLGGVINQEHGLLLALISPSLLLTITSIVSLATTIFGIIVTIIEGPCGVWGFGFRVPAPLNHVDLGFRVV